MMSVLSPGEAQVAEAPAPRPFIREGYRPDIDGLRALAVGAVILFHFGLGPFGGGFVGVDVFFVISGFLIVTVLRQSPGLSLAGFAERRLRRILPALLVVLAAMSLCAATLLPTDLKEIGLGLINAATFTANIYFLRLADDYFAVGALAGDPVLHTWSLGVEAQFYLAVALLWALGRRWPSARGPLLGMLGLLAFAASLLVVARKPEAAFYLMPLRFWEFMIGAAATLPASAREGHPAWRTAAVPAGVALVLLSALLETPQTPFPGLAALPPCLGTALAIRGGTAANPASRWLGAWPLAALGRLSYSLYLWHWPILVFAGEATAGPLPLLLRAALLAPTVLLAAATFRFVERPLITRRRLGRPGPFLAAAAVGVLVVGLAGLVVNLAGQDRLVLRHFPQNVARLAAGQFDRNEQNCPVQDADGAAGCRFGVTGAEPRLLLWGNSFARMWLPALDAAARGHGVAGRALLMTRCPPLSGAAVDALRGCAAFNRDALRYLDAHPTITTILLGGNWSAWSADLPTLDETVAALAARGRRVALILSPPAVPYRVPRTLARAALHDVPPPPLIALEAARQARGIERAAVAALATRRPLTVLDPFPAFCGAVDCAVAADGHALYADDEHVTRFGAARAQAVFDPLFATVAGGT